LTENNSSSFVHSNHQVFFFFYGSPPSAPPGLDARTCSHSEFLFFYLNLLSTVPVRSRPLPVFKPPRRKKTRSLVVLPFPVLHYSRLVGARSGAPPPFVAFHVCRPLKKRYFPSKLVPKGPQPSFLPLRPRFYALFHEHPACPNHGLELTVFSFWIHFFPPTRTRTRKSELDF